MLAPIVIFIYDRLDVLVKTVDALKKNTLASESDLFVYSDGAKNQTDNENIKIIRDYIRTLDGFKTITLIEREKNFGLSASIIDGVTEIVNRYGKVIVLEDDLLTHPHFLTFMNDGLNAYENDPSVASIHGHVYPMKGLPKTFFLKGADCWGWATWKRGWENFELDGKKLLNALESRNLTYQFDFNHSYPYTKMLQDQIAGKNNSWAIRWYASAFLHDMLTLYPGKSFVRHIGYQGGTHFQWHGKFDPANGTLNKESYSFQKITVAPSAEAFRQFTFFFKKRKFIKLLRIMNIFLWMKQ
ncbi:glycosyltransferase [Sulfuricurvum sp.]|uniref:glycosyltransferase n=1 Tax=Sulfuricurvum sp. TaxID=2025608 RepID=UPI00286E7513|nr:glycosyltransferase [Sulfuricurvum sp.]